MKRKLIILAAIIIAMGGLYGFDFIRSKMFHIRVESILPNPAVADGQSPVQITVRVTDHQNTPVQGHWLFALPRNGGMFRSARLETDADGRCTFIYFPVKAGGVVKLRDANIVISDESNSIFIEVAARTELTIALTEPEKETLPDGLLDGVFN